jgi:hypothetical protein
VRDYLRRFDRINLCPERWKLTQARETAEALLAGEVRPALVLFGAKVCSAFRLEFIPFTSRHHNGQPLVILPHPSGLCRLWHEPGAITRARFVLETVGVLPAGAPDGPG